MKWILYLLTLTISYVIGYYLIAPILYKLYRLNKDIGNGTDNFK